MIALSGADSDLVADLLAEYGTRVRVAMAAYLKPREPRRYLYNLAFDYPRRGGRMLRPSLCLATARGSVPTTARRCEQRSPSSCTARFSCTTTSRTGKRWLRRGRKTLNALCGSPIAVNVGDALIFLG